LEKKIRKGRVFAVVLILALVFIDALSASSSIISIGMSIFLVTGFALSSTSHFVSFCSVVVFFFITKTIAF